MLTLHSSDFPCDTDTLPSHSLASASWQGQKWEVGVAGTILENSTRPVVCQKSGPPLLYLSKCGPIDSLLEYHTVTTSSSSAELMGLRMIFSDAMSKEKWGRGFFLNEGFQLRQKGEVASYFLFLSPHGWGELRSLCLDVQSSVQTTEQARFLWSQADERAWLLKAAAPQIIERLIPQWHDSNSDLNFSRRFEPLSYEEQQNVVWPCQHGNVSEMKRVLTWALLAQQEFWSIEGTIKWALDLERDEPPLGTIYSEHVVLTTDASEAALRQVRDHFQPERDKTAPQRHLHLRFSKFAGFAILIENPSGHERAEATQQWQDWQKTFQRE